MAALTTAANGNSIFGNMQRWGVGAPILLIAMLAMMRSEERRVGKECA